MKCLSDARIVRKPRSMLGAEVVRTEILFMFPSSQPAAAATTKQFQSDKNKISKY